MDDSSFQIAIFYGTLSVYVSEPADDFGPTNMFVGQHHTQGFAWRPGHIDFFTPEADAVAQVTVRERSTITPRAGALRAVVVPFVVGAAKSVTVESVFAAEVYQFALAAGSYALLYEVGDKPDILSAAEREAFIAGYWCDLTFIPATEPVEPAILRADADLAPTYPLLMTAQRPELPTE